MFKRDTAGFNNLRLQSETMIGLAAIFNRTLVLPAASKIDHIDDSYHELKWMCPQALSNKINFITAEEFTKKFEGPITKVDLTWDTGKKLNILNKLKGKAWFVPSLRITHFESYFSSLKKEQQQIAAEAIFYGCRIKKDIIHEAALNLHGFEGQAYDAVHVRMGDFWSGQGFRKSYFKQMSGESVKSRIWLLCKANPARPLLVLTNAKASYEMLIINKLKKEYPAPVTVVNGSKNVLRSCVVDMLLAVPAYKFVGTADSTYSLGIMQWRAMVHRRGAVLETEPLFVQDSYTPNVSVSSPGWNRITNWFNSSNWNQAVRALNSVGSVTPLPSNVRLTRHDDYIAIDNLLRDSSVQIVSKYFEEEITAKKLKFKDAQSDRYIAHDHSMGKLLHKKVLDIVRFATKDNSLVVTYSYFCGYVNGSQLPSHTDREACEWTLSLFLKNDPADTFWPIYVQSLQKTDHYHELSVPVGGALLFQGRSRKHFRKVFTGNAAYYLLLHFARSPQK